MTNEPYFVDYETTRNWPEITDWASDYGCDIEYVDELVADDPNDPYTDIFVKRGYAITPPSRAVAIMFKLTWGGAQ